MDNISTEYNFSNLITKNMTEIQKKLAIDYLNQLSPIQIKALYIAKDHLGSSFHLLKSNGFIKFSKSKE